ncbi:hypothetical protein FCV25MIE_28540 [Fagus crenata]
MAGPSLGLDTSKETTTQSSEILQSSVDNLEQHLREIDLALNSPPFSSGLTGNKGFDQSMPLEHGVSGNSQDLVINALVNLHANKQPAGARKSQWVILEDINQNGLMQGRPKQKNKKKQSESISKAHLQDKENIPSQTPQGLDSVGLHEVDVQGESHGMWKWINRTKDHTFNVGSLSSLLGTKRGGLWSEEEKGGDG